MNTLHFSTLAIWDMKDGKGRLSTYLPLKGMVERGHRVEFICDNPKLNTGTVDGIICKKIQTPSTGKRSLFRFLLLPLSDWCFYRAGLKAAQQNKPKVVYAHCVISAVPAYWIAKKFNAKFVIRLYGVGKGAIDKWRHFPSYMMRRRSMLLDADAFILTNDGTAADKFAKRFGVPNEKIFFLKNGIKKDVDLEKDVTLRNELAPKGENVVISVSRLQNWKQVDLIIKMMPDLVKKVPVKLVIIGDGPEKESLNNLVDELNVRDYVIFLGGKKQGEVFKYLNVADVFVSMNYLSSMSNPVFEAMICGKPVIALNKGTTTDLIHHNENGIVIDENRLNDLPKVVAELLQDKDRLARIGQNARQYMLNQWPTWEERVQQEINIIENL